RISDCQSLCAAEIHRSDLGRGTCTKIGVDRDIIRFFDNRTIPQDVTALEQLAGLHLNSGLCQDFSVQTVAQVLECIRVSKADIITLAVAGVAHWTDFGSASLGLQKHCIKR